MSLLYHYLGISVLRSRPHLLVIFNIRGPKIELGKVFPLFLIHYLYRVAFLTIRITR